MFEDFENRSGFWKNLGSNFTINYSGANPSFMSSGEMWSAMDGSETQTLAAWENGWVLTNNPDGTMTATPKYTSGLISKTLVRVPVGPQTPMSSPTGGVGGVQVAYSADGLGNLLDGWKKSSSWNLKSIYAGCTFDGEGGAEKSIAMKCPYGPLDEFTLRGTEGSSMDDGRFWWKGNNELGMSNYDGGGKRSGACKIIVRDGYKVKLKIRFETAGEYGFTEDFADAFNQNQMGVIDKDNDSVIDLMEGDDMLSIDIDQDWPGIARFYLESHGNELMYQKDGGSIDDEVYVTLLGVYVPDPDADQEPIVNPENPDSNTGGSNGNGNGGSTVTACEDPNRTTNADGSCGADCNTGYELSSTTGECVESSSNGDEEEEETNYGMWGIGVLVAGVVIYSLM